MGKAIKTTPTDPAVIKEALLEKYPPKVARKRAKQILINEAMENTTPEITANVRTIPGIITMRGCTYAGCKGRNSRSHQRYRQSRPWSGGLQFLRLADQAQPDRCLR
jgi:hypothetical protein